MKNSYFSAALFDEAVSGRFDSKFLKYNKDIQSNYDRETDYDKLGKYICEVKSSVSFEDGVEYKFYDTSVKSVNEKGQFVNYKIITKDTAPSRAKQVAIENTIIIANLKTNRGKAAIVTDKEAGCVVSSGYLMIKPNDNMDIHYLQAILQCEFSLYYLRQIASTGLGMANWSYSDLSKIRLKVPDIAEQQRTLPLVQSKIKSIEEKIEKLVIEKEKNSYVHKIDKQLCNLLGIKFPEIKNFLNSLYSYKIFDEMNPKLSIDANMGDLSFLYESKFPIMKMSKLVEKGIITDIQDGSHQYSPTDTDIDDNGINYIQVLDMTPLGLKPIKKKITEKFYDKVGQGYLKPNDVLLSVIGTVGISCIYDKAEKGAVNVNIMYIRTDTSLININYLKYWLNSIFFNYQIMIDKTNMSRDQISLQKLLRSKIIIPDIEIQTDIVKVLDNIVPEEKIYDEKINKLKRLIDTSLNKYILNGYSDDLFTLPKEDEE